MILQKFFKSLFSRDDKLNRIYEALRDRLGSLPISKANFAALDEQHKLNAIYNALRSSGNATVDVALLDSISGGPDQITPQQFVDAAFAFLVGGIEAALNPHTVPPSIDNLKNAMVDTSGPIQPPQALVAATEALCQALLTDETVRLFGFLNNIGATSIASTLVMKSIALNSSADLTGNALTLANVNSILAAAVASGLHDQELLMDGGTSAAPVGQGADDKATLTGIGWTVTTNAP